MQCGQCGESNPENVKFCIGCAAPFNKRCPQCGTENPPRARFCGECATALSTPVQSGVSAQASNGSPQHPTPHPQPQSAERRQLTVMFCDLVGSTALSAQLDPEDLREVVRAYQDTCAAVIRRYDGYIAQHLGDGLLVYFGFPTAHEDDAIRAVRAGLEVPLALTSQDRRTPLHVRVGIHTGLVVIGEIGSGERREILALGETPNIAARIQGQANSDEVMISAATHRLIKGFFDCEALGAQEIKGIATPMGLYRVIRERAAQSRFEVAVGIGLTPLVGREEELGVLQRRWTQAKDGSGQVVCLSGEAGIGKSRLVQTLKEQAVGEGATRIEFRCSPYHQNSALYPIIDHLQRLLQFQRDESPQAKLAKLQQLLATYRFPQTDTLPLLASVLSLPQPEGMPRLMLSPQKQKQKTQEALVAWIMEETQHAAVYCAWEDLHWADPSTLEVLSLFLEQIPTTRMFTVLTYRPEFRPPWHARSYLSQLTLSRLARSHVEAMVENVAGGRVLPPDVVQQIVTKTDGVPLFVEEVVKSVVESAGAHDHPPLQSLDIPVTLQGALMARLDRLGPAKEIAQLSATIGREFSYELLDAVASIEESPLQQGLRQLVDAELIYQRGLPPHATYTFKHALIQDTAYQSLLKSTRQQYHQQIAQVLEEQFGETTEAHPELVAHHYTEAGLKEHAIPHWHKAGQRAVARLANAEAVSHLTTGLELLATLRDTPERTQQELVLQMTLGPPQIATKGHGAIEVEKAYARALELCQQVGETPHLFSVLFGLRAFYISRMEYITSRKLGEQCLALAQRLQNPTLLTLAHQGLGAPLLFLGEFAPARHHFEQGIALYDPQQHNPHASSTAVDPKIVCLTYGALALQYLGYSDQALKWNREALTLAEELAHLFNLGWALYLAVLTHLRRGEGQLAQESAERLITLATEQGFAYVLADGTFQRGEALVEQGKGEEGVVEMRQGLAVLRAMQSTAALSYRLGRLAEGCGKIGEVEEGLALLTEALAVVSEREERIYEAELYRLKGELTLQKLSVVSSQLSVNNPQAAAEEDFLKAIEIARKQQAKSLELRATMSLARLWQQQGKRTEAHQMLSEVYNWFTEGFDTKDLQEAKALLAELA